jgi:predicted O-methyltransferase YrrM
MLRNIAPYGLVQWYWSRARGIAIAAEQRDRTVRGDAVVDGRRRREFSHAAALDYLAGLGISPRHAREGSMPLPSLELVRQQVDRLASGQPLLALHIGNFLGVSLGYLAHALRQVHPQSKVISIDPNISHRGIERPGDITIALLTEFGIEDSVAILQGYSLEKNISNDGVLFDGYDPLQNWARELACTNQLALLICACPARFDICLMDGNHEAGYLSRELSQVQGLLRKGGILVLDDVSDDWPEIQQAFVGISTEHFTKITSDGRIGLMVRN